MVEIKFFGGVCGEIGGNIIRVATKDSNIFLDMGVNFRNRRKYYDDIFIRPSSKEELIEIGVLPDLDVFKSTNTDYCDGILISHAHSDHYKFISLINRQIPVYSSLETMNIINCIFQTLPKTFENDYSKINFASFKKSKTFQINDIEILPIEVDHSIIGAYSFIIYTDTTRIFYTGDFRAHGMRKDLFSQLIDILKEEKIDVLITEATRAIDFSLIDENDVGKKLYEILSKEKEPIFIDTSLLDFDRINTILKVSSAFERHVIIPPRLAYYLLFLEQKLGLKLLQAENVLIYEKDRYIKNGWIKDTYSSCPSSKKITKDEILREPERYIFVTTFLSPAELKEIKPPRGSIFILSTSEPFDEERELAFDRLINWLEFLGIPFIQIHSSGHIDILSLRRFINQIKPKIVIPIHTSHPELVGKLLSKTSKVILPKKEVPYTFR